MQDLLKLGRTGMVAHHTQAKCCILFEDQNAIENAHLGLLVGYKSKYHPLYTTNPCGSVHHTPSICGTPCTKITTYLHTSGVHRLSTGPTQNCKTL